MLGRSLYKFTPSFWNRFAKKEHYFKGSVLLEELKSSEYLNFLKGIDLNNGLVLKTDLYVEAKDKKDNFLPYLKINQCIGMDISLEIVKMARRNISQYFSNRKFVVADVRHLPFKESSFNVVISDSTLDHIPTKDLYNALLEIKMIIAKEGKFILSLNNSFNFVFLYDRIIKNLFFNDYFLTFSYKLRYLHTSLSNLGFKIIRRDYIIPLDYFILFLIKLSNITQRINYLSIEWLSIIRQICKCQFLKTFFCFQFIVLLEKINEKKL